VPAPLVDDADKFLRGDGTWGLPAWFGLESAGLVPVSTPADADKFLRGDATWGTVSNFNTTDAGLVPAPQVADAGKFLRGDGTWGTLSIVNTGTPGLVPAPAAGDENRFLTGNGIWSDAPAPVAYTASSVGTGSGVEILRGQFGLSLEFRRIASVDTALNITVVNQQVQIQLMPQNIPLFSTTERGMVPPCGSVSTTRFLRDDGVWSEMLPVYTPLWYSKVVVLNSSMPNDITKEYVLRTSTIEQMISHIMITASLTTVGRSLKVRVVGTKSGSDDIFLTPELPLTSATPIDYQNNTLQKLPDGFRLGLWVYAAEVPPQPFNTLTGGNINLNFEWSELPLLST